MTEANPNLPDLPSAVVVLRWTHNSADELCFAIERKVGDGPWQWLSAVQADQLGTYDDGLVGGASVCYRVFAGNDAGRSAFSNEACLIQPSSTPTPTPEPGWPPDCNLEAIGLPQAPHPPSNLRITVRPGPGFPQTSFIDFTWEDNSANEACFLVDFTKGEGSWYAWGMTGPDQTALGDVPAYADLPGMAGWCFRVFAANEWGRSEPSNEACLDLPPLPTPTPTAVGCDFPTPTPVPGMTPVPEPTATAAPAAPSDLQAELVPDPELESGLAVELTWQDNSDNESCFAVVVRTDGEPLMDRRGSMPFDGSTTGPMTMNDIPDRIGLHCYQVYYGNGAGRSYSNEACVNVEVLPVWRTATPIVVTPVPTYPLVTATPPTGSPTLLPPACRGEGPVGAPGAPNPPTEFHAALGPGHNVCEGFVVRLHWNDNADDELCHVIERKVGAAGWSFYQGGGPSSTGPVWVEDIPQRVGVHCYRVYYGNEAGRSAYSDEACVLVEVVPRTVTPLFTPTPAPAWPPGCNLEGSVGSPRAPNPPSSLTVALRDEPGLPQPAFVDFAWDDNSTDEACFLLGFEGPWWITELIGPDQAAFSKAAYAERCGMAGYWCYRVSAANEWGVSEPSNKVCLEIGPSEVSTPAATATVAPAAAVGELPATGGATGGGGLAWWWWAPVAAGSVTAVAAAVGLAWVARRRR